MHARALSAAVLLVFTCSGEETGLSLDERKWIGRLFETGNIAQAEAGEFGVTDQQSIFVGPWRAGSFALRYEYTDSLPARNGRITGRFRTEGLMPYEAAVSIGYYKGTQRLGQYYNELGASSDWTRFDTPIRRIPAGADRIVVGVALLVKANGRAFFSELRVSDEPLAPVFPQDVPRITRRAPPSFPPAPFFRLEQHQDTWWLVRPDGRAFYSIGVDAPGFDNTSAGLAQGRHLLGQTRALGFNSLAGWHSVARWGALNDTLGEEALPSFRALETGTMTSRFDRVTDAKGTRPGNHTFPDPYDPAWEAALRERVKPIADVVRGRKWFIGWFADNEVAHADLHRYVYSPHASQALRSFLEDRHETIESLNLAWGTEYESFESILQVKPDPVLRSGAMFEDYYEFSRELVRRYARTVARVIREYDPDHLIFTNRFMRSGVRDWVDRLDLYDAFDAVAVNLYPANLSAGLSDADRDLLRLVHQRTGKPLLLTEWSVPALDSGLYDNPARLDWSYPQTVDTQAERGRQAAHITSDLYNLPFVIGSHWFTWRDFDSADRQANRGLFHASGEAWTELQEALRGVHSAIQAAQ